MLILVGYKLVTLSNVSLEHSVPVDLVVQAGICVIAWGPPLGRLTASLLRPRRKSRLGRWGTPVRSFRKYCCSASVAISKDKKSEGNLTIL